MYLKRLFKAHRARRQRIHGRGMQVAIARAAHHGSRLLVGKDVEDIRLVCHCDGKSRIEQ
jgi:hypothetical protein